MACLYGCCSPPSCHMNVVLHACSRNMHVQGLPALQCASPTGWRHRNTSGMTDAVIGSMGSMQSNGMQPIAAVDFWVTAGIHCYTHSLCPQRSPLLVFMACLVIWPKPEFLRSRSPWSNTTWAWVAVSHCWSRQNRKVPKWTTRVPHFSACPHYVTRTMPPPMNWVSSLFTAGI